MIIEELLDKITCISALTDKININEMIDNIMGKMPSIKVKLSFNLRNKILPGVTIFL